MWSDEEEDFVGDRIYWDKKEKQQETDCDSLSSEADQSDNKCNKEFTLYVSGLVSDVYEHDLQELFVQFGSITRVNVIHRNDKEFPSTTYGFVSFAHREDAVAAINKLNETDYRGHTLLVSWSKSSWRKNTVHSSKNYQNKEDKVEEDDNNLYRLINVYTYLVSKHPNDLPDLGQLLRDMQKIPNKLIGPYTENDCEVTIDLKAVHESFMESLIKEEDEPNIMKSTSN
ncbi:hypothetical protein LSH36_3g17080 [Paralvinella palmiformis]|uniref:RRM domain-containing protein n=1 Tax=Paralvinella palmiformis TaxID=53620 RepID=A0AAD9KGW8_9ANNE|nr:hypothetical protein LSH36_3g17080 [Paralvinella palmiformis]